MIEKIPMIRSRQRIVVYFVFILCLIGINIWLIKSYYHSGSDDLTIDPLHSIYNEYDPNYDNPDKEKATVPENRLGDSVESSKSFKNDLTIKILQKQIQKNKKDVRSIEGTASIYETIFKNHEIDSIFGNLNFDQRCTLFFKNLFIEDHNWIFDPNEEMKLENKNEFKFNDYRRWHLDEFKKEFAKEHKKKEEQVESMKEFHNFVIQKYEEFWARTMKYEQTIVDSVATLRIFNKCFITNDNKSQLKKTNNFINDQFTLVDGLRRASKKPSTPKFINTKQESLVDFHELDASVLEHRVYPWLSFEYPVYERWTGHVQSTPPVMSNYIKESNQKTSPPKDTASSFFLNKFLHKSNGKGIVLSIGNGHADDTVKLIHLLRALNNKLPIQIVFYDNLSKETKDKIVTAAREVMVTVPKSFELVANFFPDDYLINGLPQQEVWFVNTYNAIHANFKNKFRKFSNKFLATLFNSFSEFMLVDADTVLTQNPEYFFHLNGYKTTGTFFYKDRSTYETRPSSDGKFFEKLSPSIIDSVLFDIPIISSYTLDLEFFKGLFHEMESGVVVLNRNIHYNSILMMLQLNFYTPVNSRIHGDKEIFWLAFAINGDENYIFNGYRAAAVGAITPDLDRPKPDGTSHESKEICSPHPGHVSSEDDALVWFNSGFLYCGQNNKVDFKEEFSHKSRLKHLTNLDDFKTFYQSPLRIESAIIPPLDLHITAVNVEDEPTKGWFMDKRYCNGYMWCAYDKIGGKTKDNKINRYEGKVINFGEKAQELFNYYGDVWNGLE